MTRADTAFTDALANLYDAGAVRVPAWLGVVTALAAAQPDGIGATIDWLAAHREELERAYASGGAEKLSTAVLPPALQFEPELGSLDRARNEHLLRDRSLFAELVGQRSFMEVTVYAITGIEISARDAELFDELATINLTLDRRAWPMAVTRRIAGRGAGQAAAIVAGVAMMGTHMLAGAAAADCARFLVRARDAATAPADLVAGVLSRRERVMGFGRPVVGRDERVPRMLDALARHGRSELPFAQLMREVEAAFVAHKGLHATSAGWVAAILLDYGMDPDAVQAVANSWVAVNVWAQAAFSHAHRPNP